MYPRRATQCESVFPAGPFSRPGGNLPSLGIPGVTFDMSFVNAAREEMIMAWDSANDAFFTRVDYKFLIRDGEN